MIWTLIHNGVAIALIESKNQIKVGRIANTNIEVSLINSSKKNILERI